MDSRKWLLKPHNKDNDNGDPAVSATMKQHNKDNDHGGPPIPATPSLVVPEKMSIAEDASPSLHLESVNTKVVRVGQQKKVKRKRSIYVDTATSNQEKKGDEVCESVAEITGTTHASGGVSFANREKEIVSSLQPWTEKYKPKRPEDIIGNETPVKNLYKWLRSWKSNFLTGTCNGKGGKQKETSVKKAVLITGASGIGKTTYVKLVSQWLGFRTIELNASDNCGKADPELKCMNNRTAIPLKEIVSNQSLSSSYKSSKHPKVVLIMDEVDAMVDADNGGLADLISSIKVSKVPIICICSDKYSMKLKGLVRFCSIVGFQKPTFLELANRLKEIASSEGLKVTEMTLKELARRVNGDVRMALNQLQYLSLKSDIKFIGCNDIKQPDHLRAIDNLFGEHAYKLNIEERLELSSSDTELLPLNVQENYINYRPLTRLSSDKLWEKIAYAADSISSGDMIDVQMRRYQKPQLLESSLITSVIPAAHLHGFRNTWGNGERNRFGSWLEKNSTTQNNHRLLVDISVKSKIGSGSTMRLDYLSPILERIAGTLKMLPKDKAVEKVVEFMRKYSISLEDLETLILLSKFQGRPNPLDGFKHDVKAALAKAYNEGSKSHVISTTDLIELPSLENKSDFEGTPDGEEKLKVEIDSKGTSRSTKIGDSENSTYVDTATSNQEDVTKVSRLTAKRKVSSADLKPPPVKKPHDG